MNFAFHTGHATSGTGKRIIGCSLGLVMSLVTVEAYASDRSMRCGGHLIYAGSGRDSSSMYEVLKKCGEPEGKHGDVWVYRQGNVSKMLTFRRDGKLQRIESVRI